MPMKEIPSSGSRKKFAQYLSFFVTAGYLITVLCVLKGWITKDEIDFIGITYDRWWIAMGVVLTVFTTGEIGAKGAHAHMNKGIS